MIFGTKKYFKAFFAFLLVLTYCSVSLSQERQILDMQNRGAQYRIGSTDELLIQVNIWGFVRTPGQYLVPKDTDLVSLISYAGGPMESAQLSKVRIVRTIDINGEGRNGSPKQKIYEHNVKEFLETGDQNLNPGLMPNDTILIKGTTGHKIAKTVQFVGQLAIIAQLTYLIIRIEQGN